MHVLFQLKGEVLFSTRFFPAYWRARTNVFFLCIPMFEFGYAYVDQCKQMLSKMPNDTGYTVYPRDIDQNTRILSSFVSLFFCFLSFYLCL